MMLVCGRCTARRGGILVELTPVWCGPYATRCGIRQEVCILSQLSRTVYRVPEPPFEALISSPTYQCRYTDY